MGAEGVDCTCFRSATTSASIRSFCVNTSVSCFCSSRILDSVMDVFSKSCFSWFIFSCNSSSFFCVSTIGCCDGLGDVVTTGGMDMSKCMPVIDGFATFAAE